MEGKATKVFPVLLEVQMKSRIPLSVVQAVQYYCSNIDWLFINTHILPAFGPHSDMHAATMAGFSFVLIIIVEEVQKLLADRDVLLAETH